MPEAIAHPAKMNAYLARDLFLRYTLPGQTVLDPFGGIGTSMLGATLTEPRHVILHELEPKFVDLARASWARIQARTLPGMPLGSVTILQGDSRHLPLPDAVEAVIGSPPYAGSEAVDTRGIRGVNGSHRGGNATRAQYDEPGNIAHLQHAPDVVLSSPPYADVASRNRATEPHQAAAVGRYGSKYGHGDPVRHVDGYSDNPQNIGNLPAFRGKGQRTKNPRTLADRLWAKVDRANPDGCWPWVGAKDGTGRGSIHAEGRTLSAHRVAWELTYGPIPNGLSVCHHCDVGECCRPDHMFLGTQADNVADMVAKGRQQHGETNGNAKLTWRQIAEIRRRSDDGEQRKDIAIAFGVSASTVSRIATGNQWAALPHAVIGSPPYAASQLGHYNADHPDLTTLGLLPDGRRRHGRASPIACAHFSSDPAQLSNQDGETYAAACLAVYRECYRVVRPGGVLVLVTGNYVRQGAIVDLAADTIALAQAAGWTPWERWRHEKAQISFWRRLHHRQGRPVVTHEDVLVFVRGDAPAWQFSELPPTTHPPAQLTVSGICADGVQQAALPWDDETPTAPTAQEVA